MKKFILILSFTTLTLGGCLVAYAHGPSEIFQTLEVKKPAVLPDSSFYFLKNIGRNVRIFFAFDAVKKAELELRFANEKLAELIVLADEKSAKNGTFEKTLEGYLRMHETLQKRLGSLQGKNKNIDTLSEKLVNRFFDHQDLFEELGDVVTKEDINRAHEAFGKTIGQAAMINKKKINEEFVLRIKKEHIDTVEKLDLIEDLQEITGGGVYVEGIKRMLENTKSRISGITELMERMGERQSVKILLQNASKKISEIEARTTEGNYGAIPGLVNAAVQLLDAAEKEISQPTKEKAKDRPSEAPKKEAGEVVPKKPEIFCTLEYNPVCGSDGKTYSNSCHAKRATVNIEYNGECKKPTSVKPFEDHVIIAPNGEFIPKTITVRRGTKVTWLNQSGRTSWPASGTHPVHDLLPAFDSLRALMPEESYSFTFTEPGSWKYHDHLHAETTGVVEVTE